MIDSFFDCDFSREKRPTRLPVLTLFLRPSLVFPLFFFSTLLPTCFFVFSPFAHGRLGHGRNLGFLERATGNGFV